MTRIAFLLGFFLTTTTTFAQIYPKQTDLEKQKLKGKVESVIDISRSYSAKEDRWEPLTATSIMRFNEQGNLLKRGIYLHREKSDKQLFVYNADADSAIPVFDATALMFSSGESKPLEEHLYAYDNGHLVGVIDRDYNTGQTIKRQYLYAKDVLTRIISRDSASDLIIQIEQFFYQKDGKPSGSSIRQFDPKTDRVKEVDDTVKVPASRVLREYTSYTYSDTSVTPVIFWHWKFGSDTIVDQQDIRRYLPSGALSSSTAQTLTDGKSTSLQTYLFNEYGDVLSSAVSFWDAAAKNDSGTTYQRGFDCVYDDLDDHKNWTVRRQYSGGGDTLATAGKRILLSRTDREIKYFK